MNELIKLHYLDGNPDNHYRQNLALLHHHSHDQPHSAKNLPMTDPQRMVDERRSVEEILEILGG